MKKLMLVYVVLIGAFLVYMYGVYIRDREDALAQTVGLHGQTDEKYVMVTFDSGIDYWKSVLKGFEDAAGLLGVSVEYRGAPNYDAHEEATVLEQVIARKPAGIALTAIDPESLVPTINKAVEAGIPVVLFDSGASASKAYSFLGTDSYKAGAQAAAKMAELIGTDGEVGIIVHSKQLNLNERMTGFKEAAESKYPLMRIVSIADGKGDELISERRAREMMEAYPNLRGIFVTEANGGVGVGRAVKESGKAGQVKVISFDTDKDTLDMVKDGTIAATIAQGTWNMGYWSLMHLFHLHHDLLQPTADWRESRVAPLPTYVDTGITFVTPTNVDSFYAK
ncbi:substrate-binding domain-containing protein [Paenibacillus thailandensis]|uniref:Substrate-binding domain-containing protein n=1 Tax=Paenibacillus thailandensis TaxID=393250 RepID=A0ABW5QWJ6_9BACL